MNRVKMKMLALAYNTLSKTGAYALILADGDDALRVPVIIGMAEAQSIAAAISKSETRRPTTHDMVRTLLGRLGVTLEEINIYGFQAGIFHAEALFRHPGGESLRLDVRASDLRAHLEGFDALQASERAYLFQLILKVAD